jgi:hypothetical protein
MCLTVIVNCKQSCSIPQVITETKCYMASMFCKLSWLSAVPLRHPCPHGYEWIWICVSSSTLCCRIWSYRRKLINYTSCCLKIRQTYWCLVTRYLAKTYVTNGRQGKAKHGHIKRNNELQELWWQLFTYLLTLKFGTHMSKLYILLEITVSIKPQNCNHISTLQTIQYIYGYNIYHIKKSSC